MTSPEIVLMPRVLNTPSRLVCRGGWDTGTTNAFQQEDFEKLVLEGGPKHIFDIPNLGGKSREIELLALRSQGEVDGLSQFERVAALDIESVPGNGIKLAEFKNLKRIFFEWDKSVWEQVLELPDLESVGCVGLKLDNLQSLVALRSLEVLGLTRGGLKSLSGLSQCSRLNTLSLAYLPNLKDISELGNMTSIVDLSVTNLPKLSGELSVQRFPDLTSLFVAATPLKVDLAGVGKLHRLQKLWLKAESTNLDWESILGIKSLSKVAIVDPGASADDIGKVAESLGRKVKSARAAGPKKSRQIQINLI